MTPFSFFAANPYSYFLLLQLTLTQPSPSPSTSPSRLLRPAQAAEICGDLDACEDELAFAVVVGVIALVLDLIYLLLTHMGKADSKIITVFSFFMFSWYVGFVLCRLGVVLRVVLPCVVFLLSCLALSSLVLWVSFASAGVSSCVALCTYFIYCCSS